jgi:rhodanese-related sulfurtransferase
MSVTVVKRHFIFELTHNLGIDMKKVFITLVLLGMSFSLHADDKTLENYISSFNYAARKDVKIDSKSLIGLLGEGKAQLIDIRFTEERQAWKVEPSKHIPLNELPSRLAEIDKGKIIVTACPHNDRAIIAMIYLRSVGIQAKYLTDGLMGMVDNLRGDNAKAFVDHLRFSQE